MSGPSDSAERSDKTDPAEPVDPNALAKPSNSKGQYIENER